MTEQSEDRNINITVTKTPDGGGTGTAGMVLGIIGLVGGAFSLIPCAGLITMWPALIINIIGLCLSISAISKVAPAYQSKAKAGRTCSLIGLCLSLVQLGIWIFAGIGAAAASTPVSSL